MASSRATLLQDIGFMGGLSIYMSFTSSCLMVSKFALCGMPFLARVHSKDFILEMFSMRYENVFVFFSLLVYSTSREIPHPPNSQEKSKLY